MSDTPMTDTAYDYDLVVIGGGSGGLAAAKEATKANPKARVACFDLVQPTVHGTKWGLGGTCVNVGCIPKKLMHHAGTMGYLMHDHAPQYGWRGLDNISHDWNTMTQLIHDYIRSLNFSYRVGLRGASVTYFEAYASFVDEHTLQYTTRFNKVAKCTFAKALIATGGRPSTLPIPGKELAVTSDDLFWLKKAPGKTLVIGAGYIALECASFLHHIGSDVSVMVRGDVLRKMDTQAGQMIGELMERDGVRFLHPASPLSFAKTTAPAIPADAKQISEHVWEIASSKPNTRTLLHSSGVTEVIDIATKRSTVTSPAGPIKVSYVFNNDASKKVHVEEFDTVLLAVGRSANTADLNLDKVGVAIVNGKVLVDAAERTTNPNIFAIGDVAVGIPAHSPSNPTSEAELKRVAAFAVDRPELTPVAIQAGIKLARRLFGASSELMQYQYVPTTVFTSPSEYAFVGLSEEQALRPPSEGGIGAENVEVFWSRFGSIEMSPLHPEHRELRSNAFVGKNLWARQYVEKHKLDWSEVTFDTETSAYVLYENDDGSQRPARVTGKSTDAQGHLVYELQFENGGESLSGVSGRRLQLQPEQAAENAELFIKANALAKLVVDKSRNNRVVGLHFLGASAGEVLQGFALAVQMGATKEQFDELVGIHPTAAEEFAVLTTTKFSGSTPLKKAGCGGGSCG